MDVCVDTNGCGQIWKKRVIKRDVSTHSPDVSITVYMFA